MDKYRFVVRMKMSGKKTLNHRFDRACRFGRPTVLLSSSDDCPVKEDEIRGT